MKKHTVMCRVLALVVAFIAALTLTFAPVLAQNVNEAGKILSGRVEVEASVSATFSGQEEINVTANCPLGKVVLGGGYSFGQGCDSFHRRSQVGGSRRAKPHP